jgi:hypothetical protein
MVSLLKERESISSPFAEKNIVINYYLLMIEYSVFILNEGTNCMNLDVSSEADNRTVTLQFPHL